MSRALSILLAGLLAASAAAAEKLDDGYSAHLRQSFARAIELYTTALEGGELSPGDRYRAHVNRGSALSVQGDYEAAIADFSIALESTPDSARVLYNRGVNHFNAGDFSAAHADFESALALEPDNLYTLIWSYLAQRRAGFDDASTGFEARARALNLDAWPGPVAAWYLDQRSLQDLVSDARDDSYSDQVAKTCEVGYYVGQRLLLDPQGADAERWLATALAACKPTFVEYSASRAELARLSEGNAGPPGGAPPAAASAAARSEQADAPAKTRPAGETRLVTSTVVNLRSGPGTQHPRLTALARGQELRLVRRAGEWMEVDTGAGTTGFVHRNFVREAVADAGRAESVPLAGSHTHVTTAPVHYRAGPGTGYQSLGGLARGSEVLVDGESGEWLRVRLANGERAFVHRAYLAAVPARD